MRQLVIESDEMLLIAWTCYRRTLHSRCFQAWRNQYLRCRNAKAACKIAQARLAEWYYFRYIFRTLIRFLRLGVQHSEWHADVVGALLAQGRMRKSARIWKR